MFFSYLGKTASRKNKSERERKDRYYSRSRSIEIKAQMKKAKKRGLRHVSKRA